MTNRTYNNSNVLHISVPRRVETPKKVRCSSSSVSLQWIDTNKRNLPISYTVKWTSLSTSEIKNNSGITERFTTINGLQPNTAYDFTVTAENVAGSSDECAPKRIATGNLAAIIEQKQHAPCCIIFVIY